MLRTRTFARAPFMRSLSVSGPFRRPLAWIVQVLGGKPQISIPAPHSQEFLVWRHHFLHDRVRLLAQVVWITLVLLDGLTVILPCIQALATPGPALPSPNLGLALPVALSQILGVLLCLGIVNHPSFLRYPERLFLLLSGVVLLLPQIIATLQGQARFDVMAWILFYALQAILIPIQWQLHVVSQSMALGYWAIAALLGSPDPYLPFPPFDGTIGVSLLLVCLIADWGVFLYERSLQQQFDLRQQIQVFLHAVSHDLRNPVLGTGMLLRKFLRTPEEEVSIPKRMLEQLVASGDRQIELLNALLETHTSENHGLALHPQPLHLQGLVQSVIEDVQPLVAEAKAHLMVTLPQHLPPLEADSLQLRRVYETLIANTLNSNPPGLHLTLGAELVNGAEPGKVRCTIADNGPGIPLQECHHLFDLYRYGPDRRQPLSLGLGLYRCRQIITAHGGEIGVTSQPGEGTVVWFTLPVSS